MCTRISTRWIVFAIAFMSVALFARRAAADPIAVSGFLQGVPRFAFVEQQLDLAFPDFTISIAVDPRLSPGFSFGADTGTVVPFTQTTGTFFGRSTSLAVQERLTPTSPVCCRSWGQRNWSRSTPSPGATC
jgi:hypothetical protein